MRFVAVVCCLVGSAVGVRAAGNNVRIALRVTPQAAMAPAFVRVEVSVERDANNRALAVVAESPEFYRSSQVQLNGASSPRVMVFEFPQLPSGLYEVRGILADMHGETVTTSRMVRIAPGLGEGK